MSLKNQSVFSFLSASPCAKVANALDLGLGRSAAIWRNAHDRMSYERPDGHTFSLYLEGGSGTRRTDHGGVNGWPGALCIMPQGASSEWEITDVFEFVHLYVPDEELRRTFTEIFDRDCRLMIMPEATFDHAPALAEALRKVADATRSGDRLLADEAIAIALASLFVDPRYGGIRPFTIKSGLAPAIRRRITDYIEAHLDAHITLPDLAAIAGLSEFHLQRMFRASCGVSPHGWVLHRRLAHAKALLAGTEPIAQIASACGFSSQSHLTRVFKAMTGTTPLAYRQSVFGRA
jgi:AraC family transcriptional regulator